MDQERPMRRVDDRLIDLGALCWLLKLGYLAVQLGVSGGGYPSYSWTDNTISDLGNIACGGPSRIRYCSPDHVWMNLAFPAAGMLTIAGVVLTRRYWPRRRLTTAGLLMITTAGVGAVLVGLAPADSNAPIHAIGAGLQVPGAIGIGLLGLATRGRHRPVSALALFTGAVASVACGLFFLRMDLGLGLGGMERLAFDTLTVWNGVMAVVILLRSRAATGPPRPSYRTPG